jgi:DNA polymerase ligase (LigD)-like protein
MPRFAILAHDHPTPHWDLFLESGPVLRAWRLPVPLQPGADVPAEPTPDHRLAYLDYEGPVAGGRGTVIRIEAGTFEWRIDRPGWVAVRLAGARFAGLLTLRQDPGGWSARLDPL